MQRCHLEVLPFTCFMQSCPAITVHQIDISPPVYQCLYKFKMATVAGSVKGCGSPRCLHIDNSTSRQEQLTDGHMIGA